MIYTMHAEQLFRRRLCDVPRFQSFETRPQHLILAAAIHPCQQLLDMQPVTIYTTMLCPYCHRAKRLLKSKGVAYDEINVSRQADRAKMRDRAGGRHTVPQIFIGETHVGGCDELYELERKGRLDPMLAGKSAHG